MGFILKYSLLCLLTGALGVAAFSTPAFADKQDFIDRMNNCKSTTSLVTRAQCYDTVMDDFDLNTFQKRSVADNGTWKFETKKSTMTDNINVSLSLPSIDLFTTKDDTQVRRFLVLSCTEGRPSAYVSWNTAIGNPEGSVNVVYNNLVNWRLGSDPVVAEKWALSTDKTASFVAKPTEFIQGLLANKGMLVVTVWAGAYYDTVSVKFNPQGLADRIKPLKDACHLP